MAGWTAPLAGRVAAAAVVVGLLAVVVTGRDGGRECPVADPEPPAVPHHMPDQPRAHGRSQP